MTMIGIDPHKATHTAVAVDDNEEVIGEVTLDASIDQIAQLTSWAASSPNVSGRSSPPMGSAILLVGNSSQRVKRCSMCHPCSHQESGSWDLADRKRTTRTMPVR